MPTRVAGPTPNGDAVRSLNSADRAEYQEMLKSSRRLRDDQVSGVSPSVDLRHTARIADEGLPAFVMGMRVSADDVLRSLFDDGDVGVYGEPGVGPLIGRQPST
jgi:hypothetical protein